MPPRKRPKVTPPEGIQVSTLVGRGGGSDVRGWKDGAAAEAKFASPYGLAIDGEGNVIVADSVNNCIRKVTPDGTVSTLAGSGGNDGYKDGAEGDARFNNPAGVAIDGEGNVIVADSVNNCIRKVTPDGTVSTLAGSGEDDEGYTDGAASHARFNYPISVAIDGEGNVIVADSDNHCIRKVTPDGTVSTLAGSGEDDEGYKDGAASHARFNFPLSVAIDGEGNVIVADMRNHCIRKVTPDGTVSTLAGSGEDASGYKDGAAGDARFSDQTSVAIDGEGNVIVADMGNHCIRKVTPDGTVSTLAGSRGEGDNGYKDGAASDARFDYPASVAIDGEGNVIVSDSDNHCLRMITGCQLSHGLSIPRWPVRRPSLGSDLSGLLEDTQFSDATFDVAGTRFVGHRAILAVRSEYFRRMFSSSCTEAEPGSVVTIGDTTPEAFGRILTFLYTDEIKLDDAVVVDVLRKANELALTPAYNLCMRYCSRHVRPSNAVGWFVRAHECRLDELREVVLGYIRQHFVQIREAAPQSLEQLIDRPELLHEIMMVIQVVHR